MQTNNNGDFERAADLNKEQKEAVNFTNDGELLIKGMPGCGKTTVIVHRALTFVSDYENLYGEEKGRILIVAFNRALAGYIKTIIRNSKDLSEAQKNRIDVSTFHQMASSVLRKIGVPPPSKGRASEKATDEAMMRAITRRKQNRSHRLLEKNVEFWKEEISWMKGWGPPEREIYVNKMPRTGRGTGVRVTKEDRDHIFDVYELFQEELGQKGLAQWDDMALELYENLDKLTDEHKYNHVLVDEAQDFPPIWLITVNKLTRFSLTVAADVAQKIYKRAFSFKDCGINVTGKRSKTLDKSYRCTKQIVALAQAFRDQMTHIRNSEELADLPVPDHDGIPPVWIHRDNKDEAMRELIDALNSLKEAGTNFNTKNLVILGYRHKDGKQVVAALKAVGLNAQQVRRDQLSLDGEFIPVTTLYQVKGLEFKHVFIWGLRDSVIPGASLHYKDDDADEEEVIDYGRRLLYVAVTRAKEGVWMFSDSKTPTRFISELDNDLYENL
jgi:superfamily I DNA/RNA helicase